MTPPYFAALVALVAYTSSHIAEIVRGSIQAVPRGQGEAADALALSGFQRMWYVVLPQAMRIGVPPIGNQYLNLTKNTSLAAVISFPELTQVTQLSVANRSPAVPVVRAPAADLPRALAADLRRRQPRQSPPGDRGAMTGCDPDHSPRRWRCRRRSPRRQPAAGPGDWVRRNLFRTSVDGVVTVVAAIVVGYVALPPRSLRVRHRSLGDRPAQPHAVHGRPLPARRAVADRRRAVRHRRLRRGARRLRAADARDHRPRDRRRRRCGDGSSTWPCGSGR